MFRALVATPGGRGVAAALITLVLVVTVALVALWPRGADFGTRPVQLENTHRATVTSVERRLCPEAVGGFPCQVLFVEILEGPEAGQSTYIGMPGPEFAPAVEAGDKVLVRPTDPTRRSTAEATAMGVDTYAFVDFERKQALYVLALVFALLAIALARAKGFRALIGLGLSLVVVTQFMVPAILDGTSALAVALVGSLAVMLLTIVLAHGAGVTSIAAILGGATTLVATAVLGVIAVETARISGFAANDLSLIGTAQQESLSVQGLVLAGLVVGALGVLDDLTVSQASTVLALRRANPAQSMRTLFREALAVGRDHLSATVNTLVLAYAGAALPLLLVLEAQDTTFGEAINSELIATQIVAMLVGSIGLMLAVPLTTGLAAWLARFIPDRLLPDAAHAHHH